jgi:hypothetical protein
LVEYRVSLIEALPAGRTCEFSMSLDLASLPCGLYQLNLDIGKYGEFWLQQKVENPHIANIIIPELSDGA